MSSAILTEGLIWRMHRRCWAVLGQNMNLLVCASTPVLPLLASAGRRLTPQEANRHQGRESSDNAEHSHRPSHAEQVMPSSTSPLQSSSFPLHTSAGGVQVPLKAHVAELQVPLPVLAQLVVQEMAPPHPVQAPHWLVATLHCCVPADWQPFGLHAWGGG